MPSGLAVLLLLLLLLVAPCAPARGGDAALARFLFDGGKEAVQKRKYEDGIARLQKALVEDPTLLEAHYWIGFAQDKSDKVQEAVTEYRQFRDGCKACDGKLDRSLGNLLKKALARLKVLAAAENELDEMTTAFVADLLDLAERSFLRDPALAREVVATALAVAPADAQALKLKAKLEGEPKTPAAPQGEGPTHDVATWDDFLATSMFGTNDGWSYANGHLFIDHGEGQFVTPKRGHPSSKRFVYEIEAKIDDPRPGWCLGFCFAKNGETWLACHFARAEVVLWRIEGAGRHEDLVRHPIDPIDGGVWTRLAIAVEGTTVDVYLNGEKIFTRAVDGVKDLDGDVGTFHQKNRCEIRVLRLGKRK